MHNASFSDHMASWDRLGRAVANNASDLPHLQHEREALARARREAEEARQRQAVARAAAQQATRDLEAAMASAHEAATRLRSGLWGHYGRKSNTLIEFGMRPYAPARQREIAPPRWGTLPQRGPEPPSPPATPERDGETFPIDARTSVAGAQRPFALGNGSPTSPSDARAGWQPAHGDSPWPVAGRPFPHGAGTTPTS
jgi:hypothetical protein